MFQTLGFDNIPLSTMNSSTNDNFIPQVRYLAYDSSLLWGRWLACARYPPSAYDNFLQVRRPTSLKNKLDCNSNLNILFILFHKRICLRTHSLPSCLFFPATKTFSSNVAKNVLSPLTFSRSSSNGRCLLTGGLLKANVSQTGVALAHDKYSKRLTGRSGNSMAPAYPQNINLTPLCSMVY